MGERDALASWGIEPAETKRRARQQPLPFQPLSAGRLFLSRRHFSEFLRSHHFCKYQIEVLTSGAVYLADILFCESALFYFSEVTPPPPLPGSLVSGPGEGTAPRGLPETTHFRRHRERADGSLGHCFGVGGPYILIRH